MNRMHVRCAAVALIFAAGACDESPTNVGDLSQAEAEALAEVVGAQVINGAFGASQRGTAASGPAAAIVSYEESLSFTGECEFGGTVSVDADLQGQVDDQTGEGTVSFTLTQIHDGCVGESDDGTVFTLYGAPSVTAQLDMEVSEEMFAFDGSFDGAVDWTAGEDREGTCTIDVTFSVDTNAGMQSGSASMQGSVCGIDFSKSLSIS